MKARGSGIKLGMGLALRGEWGLELEQSFIKSVSKRRIEMPLKKRCYISNSQLAYLNSRFRQRTEPIFSSV